MLDSSQSNLFVMVSELMTWIFDAMCKKVGQINHGKLVKIKNLRFHNAMVWYEERMSEISNMCCVMMFVYGVNLC